MVTPGLPVHAQRHLRNGMNEERLNGWMNKQMNEWMGEPRESGVCISTQIPQNAAPKPTQKDRGILS